MGLRTKLGLGLTFGHLKLRVEHVQTAMSWSTYDWILVSHNSLICLIASCVEPCQRPWRNPWQWYLFVYVHDLQHHQDYLQYRVQTGLDDTFNQGSFNVTDYKEFRNDRTASGGGLIAYVTKNLLIWEKVFVWENLRLWLFKISTGMCGENLRSIACHCRNGMTSQLWCHSNWNGYTLLAG